ncbi:outer membrane beta-barrel protein [Aquiflexum lacus]|uniref:outer membrane beta-barrel protein n=1 Tax=Aquiflexum lacus TaxID=2483805 RepID=UPI001894A75B|nr:outer membrane beta-barrel protein [Aquiflexum lacus]
MTKKYILSIGLFLTSLGTYCQNVNELKVFAGTSKAFINRQVPMFGEGSIQTRNFVECGVIFYSQVLENTRVGLGFNYSNSLIDFNANPANHTLTQYSQRFQLISVPVLLEYNFFNYLFLSGGPLVDFQLTENNFSDQSGIGYLLELGGKYGTGNLSFSLFPNFKKHSAIPFIRPENSKHILTELGVQFGVGYKF